MNAYMPLLGVIMINALVAADSVLIPVQAHYLPTEGMTQLIHRVQHIYEDLRIWGGLMKMTDKCTNFTKGISAQLRESYEEYLNVYKQKSHERFESLKQVDRRILCFEEFDGADTLMTLCGRYKYMAETEIVHAR